MTFSDSRIVKALKKDWMPVWESVSDVRQVTFDLGDGREVSGTVGGEIAIYFCDEQGQVFDILPALQSPAATLRAIEAAHAFYEKCDGKVDAKTVREFQVERMREHLDAIFDIHPERFTALMDQKRKPGEPLSTIPSVADLPDVAVQQVPADAIHPGTAANEEYRQRAISTALDDATREMRLMVFSKTAAVTPSEGKITIVEPGGRGYYQWQVGQLFCGVVPGGRLNMFGKVSYPEFEKALEDYNKKHSDPVNAPPFQLEHPLMDWNSKLKQPSRWERLLFEGILHQPIGGGKFKYDSESLEALSIIED